MEKSRFVYVIRWLIYIPIAFFAIYIIERIFGWLIQTILEWELSLFVLFLFVMFLGSIIWGLFMMIAHGIAYLALQICPDKKSGGYFFAAVVGIEFIFLLFSIWQLPTSYTFYTVVYCIFMSILALELGGLLISGALDIANERHY